MTTGTTSTTARATTGTATSSGGSTSGGTTGVPVTNYKDSVIMTRTPSVVGNFGMLNITVGYVAAAPRDITVDLLDTVNYNWYGKGTVSVPAGKGVVTITLSIQNFPVASSNYFFHVWTVDQGLADVPGSWNSAYDDQSISVIVGDGLKYDYC